jgi:hypothetical protein
MLEYVMLDAPKRGEIRVCDTLKRGEIREILISFLDVFLKNLKSYRKVTGKLLKRLAITTR